MIYVDIPAEQWARKHGLTITSMICEWCEVEFPFNVPFMMKVEGRRFAGLEMQIHGCEVTGNMYLITAIDPPARGEMV
jgi:hypothetical protein